MIRPRPNIEALDAYTPGEQPAATDVVKLNTNENPWPPPPAVAEAIREACADLRRYPDPESRELRRLFAELCGTAEDRVFVGNGSDEILALVLRAFARTGDRVAYPVPGYSLYEVLCRIADTTPYPVPFPEDYALPGALAATGARVTFVANPNSPTGTFVPPEALDDLAGKLDGLLLVDEAYVDFARDHCLRLAALHDNVVVTRSLSKSFSLAGLRVGFCVAAPEIIAVLDKVRDSYNVSRPAQAGAAAALRHVDAVRANVERVVAERERTVAALQALGLEVLPSQANFVMALFADAGAARSVFEALEARKSYVRYFEGERTARGLRITIGTPDQMDALLAALRDIPGGT